MNYQVLARKWRPHSFHEMVGQTHVLRALINALDTGRLHHAYLFTGTRGVGKTTISRILTKCLNCEQGVTSTPCGVCATCVEIDEGRFIDLIEVDGASRTKVEDTRELLENIQYAPTRGRFKVYLIDEVHMLSSHSFNALLKTLEEPPPHVKFLLATTDPQKLPVTVLSRCLQFSLKNIPAERIVEHLAHVLGAETIPYEQEALWLLGRAAQGSMRDAMSLTDQAIAFGGEKVNTADVRDMLGTLDQNQVYELLFALLEGDAKQLLAIIKQLSDQSPDWLDVLAELLNVLHRIAIAQILPEATDNSLGDKEQIVALAQALPAEDVQFYYQVGLVGRRDLPLAASAQQGFEMVLLRMLAFKPADADSAPITALKKIEPIEHITHKEIEKKTVNNVEITKVTAIIKPEPSCSMLSEGATELNIEIIKPIVENKKPIIDIPSNRQMDEMEEVDEETNEDEYLSPDDYGSLLEQSPVDLLADKIPDKQIDRLADLPPLATGLAAEWITLMPELKLSGITGSIVANCCLVHKDEQSWQFQLDPAYQTLFNENQRRRIADAIDQYVGHNITLTVDIVKPLQETPAQRGQRQKIELQLAAEQSIKSDPVLQQLINTFSAQLDEASIKPL